MQATGGIRCIVRCFGLLLVIAGVGCSDSSAATDHDAGSDASVVDASAGDASTTDADTQQDAAPPPDGSSDWPPTVPVDLPNGDSHPPIGIVGYREIVTLPNGYKVMRITDKTVFDDLGYTGSNDRRTRYPPHPQVTRDGLYFVSHNRGAVIAVRDGAHVAKRPLVPGRSSDTISRKHPHHLIVSADSRLVLVDILTGDATTLYDHPDGYPVKLMGKGHPSWNDHTLPFWVTEPDPNSAAPGHTATRNFLHVYHGDTGNVLRFGDTTDDLLYFFPDHNGAIYPDPSGQYVFVLQTEPRPDLVPSQSLVFSRDLEFLDTTGRKSEHSDPGVIDGIPGINYVCSGGVYQVVDDLFYRTDVTIGQCGHISSLDYDWALVGQGGTTNADVTLWNTHTGESFGICNDSDDLDSGDLLANHGEVYINGEWRIRFFFTSWATGNMEAYMLWKD